MTLDRNAAWSSAEWPIPMPVERRSSPPLSHFAGSRTSAMWTQRTGLLTDLPPASSFRFRPGISRMSWTVIIASRPTSALAVVPDVRSA